MRLRIYVFQLRWFAESDMERLYETKIHKSSESLNRKTKKFLHEGPDPTHADSFTTLIMHVLGKREKSNEMEKTRLIWLKESFLVVYMNQ